MKVIRIDKIAKEPQDSPVFTGPVNYQRIVGTELSDRFRLTQVNFDKGVKNKFHNHTSEQILIVTEGRGIVATDSEKVAVGLGDIIFIPAGEKHWHGAIKDATFSHLVVRSPDSKTAHFNE